MKISKIIEELTELKEYIGDKDLEACIANSITTGVNVMYKNDDGGITSTSLESEKLVRQMKAIMNQDASKTMEKFNDWNDVSNTKIPLNEEIFALLEDRMNPKRLRPEVIIAHMYPAKRLLWTEQTVGDVLCYDVPAGNFHCCNGNQIKYWKYVNVPH